MKTSVSANQYKSTSGRRIFLVTLHLMVFATLLSNLSTALDDREKPALVIVIDDIGHQKATAEAALALPGNITLALLPFTPFSKEVALKAFDSGKEIILHSPMAAHSVDKNPGLGALTTTDDENKFLQTLNAQLNFIPSVRGVSNHMGSALTSQRKPMQWLMKQLKMRGLYFLDSRTTNLSEAAKVARANGVPYLERKFFLDNIVTREAITKQLEESVRYAEKSGLAVAIGHPHKETLSLLSEMLPMIEQRGVELVWASEGLEKSRDLFNKNASNTFWPESTPNVAN